MMRPTTPIGSRTEKFTASGPIGMVAPFISVTKSGEEIELRRRDHGVAHHLAHRIAAIGGIDHRELAGIVAQHLRDAFEDFRALKRQHAPPFLERGRGRGNRGFGVGRAAIGDFAQALAGAGRERIRVAAVFRLVPLPAVIGVAVLRQSQL